MAEKSEGSAGRRCMIADGAEFLKYQYWPFDGIDTNVKSTIVNDSDAAR